MKNILILMLTLFSCNAAFAYIGPAKKSKKASNTIVNRADCTLGEAIAILKINNVRAILRSSGDVWNLGNGGYIVPNTPPEIEDVSSIYAGSVWIGGYEPVEGGEDVLKIAATTYRQNGTDWYPGPLDDETGTTEKAICDQWDQFFEVSGEEILRHKANYAKYSSVGQDYPKDSIPDGVRYYPGLGNTDFALKYGFQLPDADQGLGAFFDAPGSQLDVYDPENGDYPIIDVRGCESGDPKFADQMFFYIYNDQGGPHKATEGQAIQMEVQVQAFSYESNDALNDMSFYRYKLINRAQTIIKDCYFAMWTDGDLGCSADDYIGCDTTKSLAILYNQDEVDGDNGSDCSGGVATYGSQVPILGVDYFRGPLKPQVWNSDSTALMDLADVFAEPDTFVELGMSSFMYSNRANAGNHPAGTHDPDNAIEHYRILDGKWRDGLPLTNGGSGYNIGSTDTTRFVLPGAPNDNNGWSMCSQALGFGDRRTIQASGPFILKQGAINELIIGVVWVPDQVYPCPELAELFKADDLAQSLFDNCFAVLEGPRGPTVDVVELDREIILLLDNDTLISNNKFEEYSEFDIFATDSLAQKLTREERSYKFEGYMIYQLFDPNSSSNLQDPDKARLIRQVDLQNNVTTLYNWSAQINPLPGNNKPIYSPEKMVVGNDKGIRHSFRITEDAFNQGDPRLVNHKEYYFYVVAYGYNQFSEFDPDTGFGQPRPFITGRKADDPLTVVPRPMVYDALNSFYGDGPAVTRISGIGNQGKFMMMTDDMYDKILNNNEESTVTYKSGAGPLDVKVVNPLDVKDAKFRLEVKGTFNEKTGRLEKGNDSEWILTDLTNNKVYRSAKSLDVINERILKEYGISLIINRREPISDDRSLTDNGIGFAGGSVDYKDPTGTKWLSFIQSGALPTLNFVSTAAKNKLDPDGRFTTTDGVNMIPYKMADFRSPMVTPGYRQNTGIGANVSNRLRMADLTNVDIVFTSDKSKWSKCIVVETGHVDFTDAGYETVGGSQQMELRSSPSVSKDADADGNPIPLNDGTNGFGWFPGYAVDVETGERLNIYFGENSTYGGKYDSITTNAGRDMMWNPDNRLFVPTPPDKQASIWNTYAGGQHTIYVSRTEYDGCAALAEYHKKGGNSSKRIKRLTTLSWTGIPLAAKPLKSYNDGLIPNDVTVRLRVNKTFARETDTNSKFNFDVVGDTPVYEFELKGKQATPVDNSTINEALTNVGVVPNPYYGFSEYELTQNDGRVKITNVPRKATITIYSLDGRFISQFKRDAQRKAINRTTASVNFRQEDASVVWNLKNSAGIPVASGVYLIHVVDEETGAQRTIKWFGVARKFDPSGL